jgi:hypothetical protein
MCEIIDKIIADLRLYHRSDLGGAVDEKLIEYDQLYSRFLEKEDLTINLSNGIRIEHVLMGQYYFVKDFTREQILDELSNFPPERRVDILICWGWIKAHEKLLDENKNKKKPITLYKPFECELGPASAKSRTRHNVDREFDVLRKFLDSYNRQKGKEYNFFEHRGNLRPDFELRDENGNRLGVEMTEANIDENWARAHGRRSDILTTLRTVLNLIPNWDCNWMPSDEWGIHWDEVFTKFKKEILPFLERNSQEMEIWLVYGTYIRVEGRSVIFHNDPERRPFGGYSWEEKNAEAIWEKIKLKLKGKEPKFQPTILVIFPLLDLPIDYHEIITQAVLDKTSNLNFTTHFTEIWYAYNNIAYKLLPTTGNL